MWGMLGKDWISAGDGSDAINGGDGADTLITGGVSDLYDSDTAYGAGGEDRIKGGPSNDTVRGEGGADWVQENIGPNGDYDTFYGGPGTDSGAFSDGDFNDKFYGESGNDCCPDGDCQIGGECETANWTWGADEGSGDKCACSGGHNCAA